MSTRPFDKKATTFAGQVQLLQSRGMEVEDPGEAELWLGRLNYYRLGAYWLPFEASHAPHAFKPGTRFSRVLEMYLFDRRLRLLVLDAIERIEVAIRTRWAYELAHRHGAHAHLQPSLFHPRHWQKNLDSLGDEVRRSSETFIQHLRITYSEPLPPVWAVCEAMSLGSLSRWYASLQPRATRRAIAAPFEVNDDVLQSWLQHLTHVRNFCAHHSRLWNREFTIIPDAPKHKPARLAGKFVHGSRKPYNTFLLMGHLLDTIAPGHAFRVRLRALIAEHTVPAADMGFPAGWEGHAIWSEGA
jgi:abortive infection bacteriophage resistance protein